MLVHMDTCPPNDCGVLVRAISHGNTTVAFEFAEYTRARYDALKLRPHDMAELTALLMRDGAPDGYTFVESRCVLLLLRVVARAPFLLR